MDSIKILPRASGNKLRVCAMCGKAESWHWARHWKRADHQGQARELKPGEEPPFPWRVDWVKQLPSDLIDLYDSKKFTDELAPQNTLHLADPQIGVESVEQV